MKDRLFAVVMMVCLLVVSTILFVDTLNIRRVP